MRKICILIWLLTLMTGYAWSAELSLPDPENVTQALPEEAAELITENHDNVMPSFSEGLGTVVANAVRKSEGALKNGAVMCCQILGIAIMSAVLRNGTVGRSRKAMTLAGVLAIGTICVGQISGIFSLSARIVDDMAAFASFLFPAMATVTAAAGAAGASSTIYGVTVLIIGVMTKAVESVLIPGISCYMALMIADSAVGDGSLKMAGEFLKQLITNGLKMITLAVTGYLSVTSVIAGSADQAAVKAAKLTISSTVPVVGSMIADASETLLVSASLIRSSLGIAGLTGSIAIGILPFLRTGGLYLMLKGTAAAAGIIGEKDLSGLISAMAGAMGLVAGLTGTCTLMLLISCVCFMRVSV